MKTLNQPQQPGPPRSAGRHQQRQELAVLTRTNHDMRSPLSVILGVFELLQDTDSLSDGERRYLDLGMKAAEDLLTLADGLRLYSALERNLVSLDSAPADLAAAAREHIEPVCSNKGFPTVAASDDQLRVMADEGYLKLALTALSRYVTAHLMDDVAPGTRVEIHQQQEPHGHVSLSVSAGAPASAADPAQRPNGQAHTVDDEVSMLNALRLIEMMDGSVVLGAQDVLLRITLPAAGTPRA